MEDGLERNFAWFKIQHDASHFSKRKEETNKDNREKKVIEDSNENYIKKISHVKRNKIE